MATVNIQGYDFETGGSVLHPRNKYMKQFAEQFGDHHSIYFLQLVCHN
jgi:prenylcysteine oxidase/farnesylcysteine lyase